jgi:hypothetical protein
MNTKMESTVIPSYQSPKPFGSQETFEEHRQQTLSHLVRMAKTQGFKRHAWHRVKQLENDVYGFYKGIQEEFLNKIKGNQ